MGKRHFQAPVGGFTNPDPHRVTGGGKIEFDSAGTERDKYTPKKPVNPVKEAEGTYGSVRELDKQGSEAQELSPEQELAQMWKRVDDTIYAGGYKISVDNKAGIRAELKRRYEEEGLRFDNFGTKEVMELVKNPPDKSAAERRPEGERIAYEQFRGFYARVIDDPEKDVEVVKEGARLLTEWLLAGNNVRKFV